MAQRLSCDERGWIEAMRAVGVSVEETARRLGRHRSTVYRELDRNSRHGRYGAQAAQATAQARAVRPKTPKLAADPGLAAAVAQRLSMGWSPHAVCADLRVEGRAVCAETIYAACYDHSGSRGLPEGSWRCLPRRCRKRKQRGRHTRKPSLLGDFRPIAQRSAAVQDRSEAGHWEGDLIIGANNRSAVATLVERFSRQPRHLVKTLTWDQGREMARWQDIEAATGAEDYFCEPRSPWQRPTNEQTNGLLRRWLPKGTNLNIGQVRLALIQDSLNMMPRKLHD